MNSRDEAERLIRAWDRHETERGAAAVIDFDFAPIDEQPAPADRLTTLRRLADLLSDVQEPAVAQRIAADLAYLRAQMGERPPLDQYIRATQGCHAAGWPAHYVTSKGEVAQARLAQLGVEWNENTPQTLARVEGRIDAAAAPELIRRAADDHEQAVRQATGSAADYELSIESVDVDAYWAYWLDGAGSRVRLRLNTRNSSYTRVQARQFALHEVLGHGLQSASIAAHCAAEEVPWIRLSSVHGPQQVLLEGLAQALPLFVTPDDTALTTRVRLDHYLQLVRGELHLALDAGTPVLDCAEHARARVPWWSDSQIADILADRSTNPQLRTYMWAYVAGIDWFVALADNAPDVTVGAVLEACYRAPLTPAELEKHWPEGPSIGGPGQTV